MSSFAKTIELSAESPNGFQEAVAEGIKYASQTLRNIRSAWVENQEVLVTDGAVKGYRVHLKITFLLESHEHLR